MSTNKTVSPIKIINQQTIYNPSHPNNFKNIINDKNQKSPDDNIFNFNWTEVTSSKKLKRSKTYPNVSPTAKSLKTQSNEKYATVNRYASLSQDNDDVQDEIMDENTTTEKKPPPIFIKTKIKLFN
jgi:hypothetical protein